MVIVILVGLLLVSPGLFSPHLSSKHIIAYLIGSSLIATVSWFDDIRSLPSHIRFGAHALGALLAIIQYGFWDTITIPFFGEVSLGIIGIPLTFLWITGLTNAYNFMDGIDGLAGGQAVVAGLGWATIGWVIQNPFLLIIGLLLSASSLGFLMHNWSPARIFMGDVGSTFLGYTFAVIPLMAMGNNPNIPLVGILLVWPFVFDTSITMLRRWMRGENIFISHRSHLYQRLVTAGYSHATVVMYYIVMALLGTLLAVVWLLDVPGSDVIVIFCIPLISFALWKIVAYVSLTQSVRHAQKLFE